MERFAPRTEGKEWCEQCEWRKTALEARACRAPFCSLKVLLDTAPGFPEDATPIARPVDVAPAIIERVERARQPELPVIDVKPDKSRPPAGKRVRALSNKQERLLAEMKRRANPKTGEVAVSFNDIYDDISVSSPSCVSPLVQALIERRFVSIIERRGGRAKTRYLIHGLAAPSIGEPSAEEVPEPTPKLVELMREPSPFEHPGESCASCRFGKAGGIGAMNCRRMPPALGGRWPRVTGGDWCGEYQNRQ